MQPTIQTLQAGIPSALRELNDAPERLFLYGELPKEQPVAIVGTRKPTGYGRRIASLLAARLAAAGIPVVSGLAFGIDTCAHRAVLDAGGQTIAILPGGVDRDSISPRSNLPLADRIVANGGGLLSEFEVGVTARKYHYAPRNRLISGISRAVVLVEAGIPSGSLVTAQHAADQGRDLWAVPGPIDSPASAGPNRLIRDGANPLTSTDEFMEALGVPVTPNEATGLLGEFTSSVHIDELSERLKRPIPELETELTKLELRGLIRKQNDGSYARA
jgi:DNA processing protein